MAPASLPVSVNGTVFGRDDGSLDSSPCFPGQKISPITGECIVGKDVSWIYVLGCIGILTVVYGILWLLIADGRHIAKEWYAKKREKWFARGPSPSPVPSEIELASMRRRFSDSFSQPDQSIAGSIPQPRPQGQGNSPQSSGQFVGVDIDAIEFLAPGIILPYPDDQVTA
jgi:hypothetical protein